MRTGRTELELGEKTNCTFSWNGPRLTSFLRAVTDLSPTLIDWIRRGSVVWSGAFSASAEQNDTKIATQTMTPLKGKDCCMKPGIAILTVGSIEFQYFKVNCVE